MKSLDLRRVAVCAVAVLLMLGACSRRAAPEPDPLLPPTDQVTSTTEPAASPVETAVPPMETEAPPVETEAPPTEPEASPTTSLPLSEGPAAQQARALLADRLAIDAASISVASVEPVEWPNACLGVQIPGQVCAEVLTPGYAVLLEAPVYEVPAQRFELHTNQDGSGVVAAVGLTWHREGGIAGFCDDLAIDVTGQATAFNCQGGAPEQVAQQMLVDPQRQSFYTWRSLLAPLGFQQADDAVADAMRVELSLNGYGLLQAGEPLQLEIAAFAQDVYTQLTQ